MFFKPKIWHPIAVVLGVINWLGAGWALRTPVEPAHAGLHIVLGLGFMYWAQRLWRAKDRTEPAQLAATVDEADRLDALGDDVSSLQRQLTETQERLDFAERMLAQRPVRVEQPRT